MTIKEIENQVERILAEYNLKSGPIPVEEIARKNDIAIGRTPSNKFSGLLYRKENATSFIAVNSTESLVRQRFTIAHELGHFFLHPNKNTFIDFRDNKKNIVRGQKEVQANQFAAALLMPKKLLERDVFSIAQDGLSEEHIKYLSQKYSVSENAMSFRLINLHLV